MEHVVQGFKASAVAAGIKKGSGLDFALIFSEKSTVAAGGFTSNKVKAAPVILSLENISDGSARAIIANSGNANACTGKQGLRDARVTAELVAKEAGIRPSDVLVASTGVIGAPLDMDRVTRSVPGLVKALSPQALPLVAEAIMTTDSFPKISEFEGVAGDKPYRILGMAKGAGMIMPQMATMLCFVLSDIQIGRDELRKATSASIDATFNRISVDGDTSTNDTVLVMANGMASNGRLSTSEYSRFQEGLSTVMNELATMIVRDGEGATKLVHVIIRGAINRAEAESAARTVANSTLVKTAFYGQDPNWGRIMAAVGRSGIKMKEEDVDIWVEDVMIVQGGCGKGLSAEKEAAERMSAGEFSLVVDLNQGEGEFRILTCDLTHEYVTINAEYRT